jgi:4-amino-4-deoxy-L-arabinose transferase-like glycosyltransferase
MRLPSNWRDRLFWLGVIGLLLPASSQFVIWDALHTEFPILRSRMKAVAPFKGVIPPKLIAVGGLYCYSKELPLLPQLFFDLVGERIKSHWKPSSHSRPYCADWEQYYFWGRTIADPPRPSHSACKGRRSTNVHDVHIDHGPRATEQIFSSYTGAYDEGSLTQSKLFSQSLYRVGLSGCSFDQLSRRFRVFLGLSFAFIVYLLGVIVSPDHLLPGFDRVAQKNRSNNECEQTEALLKSEVGLPRKPWGVIPTWYCLAGGIFLSWSAALCGLGGIYYGLRGQSIRGLLLLVLCYALLFCGMWLLTSRGRENDGPHN